jgi:hypothetical protein
MSQTTTNETLTITKTTQDTHSNNHRFFWPSCLKSLMLLPRSPLTLRLTADCLRACEMWWCRMQTIAVGSCACLKWSLYLSQQVLARHPKNSEFADSTTLVALVGYDNTDNKRDDHENIENHENNSDEEEVTDIIFRDNKVKIDGNIVALIDDNSDTDIDTDVELWWSPRLCTHPNRCFVLDWDDTLLPTTELGNYPDLLYNPSHPLWEDLQKLQNTNIAVIEAMRRVGQVMILTNSEDGWVSLSCQRYMPALWPLLQCVPIISARSRYQDTYPQNGFRWKYEALVECLDDHVTQLIGVGDNPNDARVAWSVAKEVKHLPVQTFRLRVDPSTTELRMQLSSLLRSLPLVLDQTTDMNVVMVPHRNGDEAAAAPASAKHGGAFLYGVAPTFVSYDVDPWSFSAPFSCSPACYYVPAPSDLVC